MKNKHEMALGEKIKQIRIAKRLSQENLADDIGSSVSTINRIERGAIECDNQTLKTIKKALGIEEAPLFEDERAVYRNRLYVWYDLICAGRLEEALAMRTELQTIRCLPFEQDLVTLYDIFEANLFLEKGNMEDTEKALNVLQRSYEEMSPPNLYHYCFCKGAFNLKLGRYETALDFLLKALNMEEGTYDKEDGLYYNISLCYSRLGQPFHSIRYAELTCKTYSEDRLKALGLYLNTTLAVNYFRVGELSVAKKLLDICIEQARVAKNELYIGKTLHNLGCVKMGSKKWLEAINYFDRAFEYFPIGSLFYFENLYQKIYSIIMEKGVTKVKRDPVFCSILAESVDLSKREKNEKYVILFKSLQHLTTLKEKTSSDYIATVTIPYLVKVFDNYEALNYCELLKQHYQKMRNPRKSLMVSAATGDIYRKMVRGETS
ncbi:MAG: helix-turn-helix domain-containing protein [Firmicutes bacterium]|nr:helix-turn-helix domain-containing protein [Bacillota bacterium]